MAAEGWQRVHLHPAAGTRAATVLDQLYAPFLRAHPDASFQVAEIDLSGGGTSSLIVRFVSKATCRSNDSCTTNILWHDGHAWHEVWSRHTHDVWVGPPSPTQWGGNMREIAGDDKLVWRWIGNATYYPDLRSIATPWPAARPAPKDLSDYARSLHPGYLVGSRAYVDDIKVDLGMMPGHILSYNSLAVCGRDGCPFIVVTGGPGHYAVTGEGRYNGMGGTLRGDGGWNRFVVQIGQVGLDFYGYSSGAYRVEATTYPSPLAPAP